MRVKIIPIIFFLLVMPGSPAVADSPPVDDVIFRVDGKTVDLSDQARAFFREIFPGIIRQCWFDSDTQPQRFEDKDQTAKWDRALKTTHILVRAPQRITRQPIGEPDEQQIDVDEIMYWFEKDGLSAIFMTRRYDPAGDHVISYFKCSGPKSLIIICHDEIRPYMEYSHPDNCRTNQESMDRWIEENPSFCLVDADCACKSGSGLPFIGCANTVNAKKSWSGWFECDNCVCENDACRALDPEYDNK